MKAQITTLSGDVAREIDLPGIFDTEYRPDLIKKAVLSLQSRRYQPHGTNPRAGLNTSAESWGSGRGVAQVPRIKGGNRVARIPQAVGGRAAHPPRTEKVLIEKINKKESRKAIRSAVAATASEDLVRARGHQFSCALPVVMEDGLEACAKTGEVVAALEAAGIAGDLVRAKTTRKVRPGRGKMRGRRYKQRKSVLIVTGDEPLRAARNIPGVDAVAVSELNAELLAPGTHAGRLTVYTESAIRKLGGE